jgi:hypothetical protein
MPIIDKNKFVKYSFVFVAIVILLKMIPRTNLDFKDILVSSLVLFSLYMLVDNIFINSSCKIENLTNILNNPKKKAVKIINIGTNT